jgi:hypothetical protein
MSTHMNFAIDEQNGPKMQKWQITIYLPHVETQRIER